MKTPRQLVPLDVLDRLGQGPLSVGLDLATTEKRTSNPSALTLSEQQGPQVVEWLNVRWKTSDDRVTKAVLRHVCEGLATRRRRLRAISVDASNERFLCAQLAREFSVYAPIRLVVSGEKTTWKGEEMTFKQLLGTLYSALYEDALIASAEAQWLGDDRRLVRREKGSFVADLGPNGEHGDTFDSGKLAYWGLVRPGRAEIAAASVGAAAGPGLRLKNWLARKRGIAVGARTKIHS